MTDTVTKSSPTSSGGGGTDGLKDALRGLGKSVVNLGLSKVGDRAQHMTGRLTDYAEGTGKLGDVFRGPGGRAAEEGAKAAASGDSPTAGALKGAFSGAKDKIKDTFTGGGGKGGKSGPKSFSNIIDSFDIGVPVRVAYNQWTQFSEWSEFMKKVEFAEVKEDEGKVSFRAKVFVLHRRWESTIVDMVPDEQIVWQSTGDKGYLNGAVTFHELAPRLTRLCLAVEYHPAGFWENTINIWRSVGSRVRLETKLYIHHVMTSSILDPEAADGWRAEIHDKQVVRTHDEVVQQEQEDADRDEEDDERPADDDAEEADDDFDEDDDEEEDDFDEDDDDQPDDEYDDDQPEDDEYDDAAEDDADEDGYEDDDEPEEAASDREPAAARRR